MEFWAARLLQRGCPVLFRGPTSGGKTALARRVLLTLETEHGYARSIELHFAVDTGARQLQRLVDRRMQRRRRGFYEPAHGREGVLVSFCFLLLLFVLSFCCFISLRESKSLT